MSARPILISGARLVDPESGYDGPGALLTKDGRIAETRRGEAPIEVAGDVLTIDAGGAMLCPGLIDLRVKTGEPGAEPKETLKSAALAAAAGGVTSIVVQPDTDPVIDDPAVVDFILRRARDIGLVHVYPAGAATKGLTGEAMAEIGLMREAGCVYVTNADKPIVNSRVMRRLLAYAGGLGVLVAHRPADPWLTAGTGARLMVDQISAADPIESLARAKARGLAVIATASINHLTFNELDIGDYRTFCKLTPPLRSESDRLALVEALSSGVLDIVVSAHVPAPAEEKRLPYDEAVPGSVGLQTLLPALLTLYHEKRAPLLTLLRSVTLAPAQAIGLAAGRLAIGAPADLVVCDIDAPVLVDAARLISKSKNSAFDGRRLQGEVRMTLVEGRVVYDRGALT